MRFRWPGLPYVFGWKTLSFGERLKLMAFLSQFGGGIAMTGFAAYAMFQLAKMKATWPVFYLGAMAMILVGIVVTGFAGLLIVRTLEVRGPGGFMFKSQDAGAADRALEGASTAALAASPTPTPPPPSTPAITAARDAEDERLQAIEEGSDVRPG